MKYITILGDGMADEPIEALGGKTPLAYATTPMMDQLAQAGEIGLAHTIPEGMKPGSDVANLAVLGYYPKAYYSGRSPLEALSIGVDMKSTDIALRCNFVTLTEEDGIAYADRTILDHSSSEITTEEAAVLLEAVKEAFQTETYQFHLGTGYRHLLIWDCGEVLDLAQPHDHLTQVIGQYLPKDATLLAMMEQSYDILNNHPINLARVEKGLRKANSCWFWGAGTRPALDLFTEKTGFKGAMISAVDLLKGIAVGAGMQVIEVEGATAGLHTNYEGKARAGVETLFADDNDFVYIHVEAPDEMGHQGLLAEKVTSIEYLDQRVIKVVVEEMEARGEDFRLLICPDHPTPLRIRTHTSEPVPFLIYDSTNKRTGGAVYNEENAAASGIVLEKGWEVANRLFGK